MSTVGEYMRNMGNKTWNDLIRMCLNEEKAEYALAAYTLLGLSMNQNKDIPKDDTNTVLAGLRTRLRSRFGEGMRNVLVDDDSVRV